MESDLLYVPLTSSNSSSSSAFHSTMDSLPIVPLSILSTSSSSEESLVKIPLTSSLIASASKNCHSTPVTPCQKNHCPSFSPSASKRYHSTPVTACQNKQCPSFSPSSAISRQHSRKPLRGENIIDQ